MLFQKVMGWVYKSNKHPHVRTPPPPRQYSQAPQGQIGIEDQTLSTSHEEMCLGTMDSFSNTLVPNVISPPNTHETPPDHANYSMLFSTTYYPWPVCSVSISTLGMSQGGVWMRTPKSNSPHLTNAWRHPLKKTQRSCSRSGLYTWERGKGEYGHRLLLVYTSCTPTFCVQGPGEPSCLSDGERGQPAASQCVLLSLTAQTYLERGRHPWWFTVFSPPGHHQPSPRAAWRSLFSRRA